LDNIHAKDACKLKSCTWAKFSDGSDAPEPNFFEMAGTYDWKIKKRDVELGKTDFPEFKMKCVIDVNLGGITPTTADKFGNKVTIT